MRKSVTYTIVAILLLIVACIVCVPYYYGGQFEKRVKFMAKNASAISGDKFRLVSYQRGWYESLAEFNVQLNNTEAPKYGDYNTPYDLRVEMVIHHGPYVTAMKTNGDTYLTFGQGVIQYNAWLEKNGQNFLKEFYGKKPVASGNIDIKFSGNTVTDFMINPINVDNAKQRVTWQGLHVDAKFDPKKYVHMRMHSTPFLASRGTDLLSVGEVNAELSHQKSIADFWLGNDNIDVANIEIKQGGDELVALANATFTKQTQAVGANINAKARLAIPSLSIKGKPYSPIIMQTVSKDANAMLLRQMVNIAQATQTATPKQQAAALGQLLEVTKSLFANGFTLKHMLSANTPEGDVKLNIDLKNDQHANKTAIVPVDAKVYLQLPKTMLVEALAWINTDGKAQQATVQKILKRKGGEKLTPVQHAQAFIQQMLTAQFMTVKGGTYATTLTYQNGALLVNGVPIFGPKPEALTPAAGPHKKFFMAPVPMKTPAGNHNDTPPLLARAH
tara:strand:- start:9744 stop:11249 length:1506 start_codon:yes stop_codon:yes gene_type:complete